MIDLYEELAQLICDRMEDRGILLNISTSAHIVSILEEDGLLDYDQLKEVFLDEDDEE